MISTLAKPLTARVNPTAPLSTGLVAAWPLRRSLHAVQRRLDTTLINGGEPNVTWTDSPWGPALAFTNAADGYAQSTGACFTSNSTTFTALVRVDEPVSWGGLLFARNPTPATGILLSGDGSAFAYSWSDDHYRWSTGISVPVGQWCLVALSVEPTHADYYVHNYDTGVFQSARHVANHDAITLENPVINIDPFASTRSPGAAYALAAIWDQALSAETIRRLVTDPFSIVRGGSCRADLLAAWAAAGAEPSVTLSQSAEAAFPDRAGASPLGLQVSMTAGSRGRYLAKALGAERRLLHTRLMVNVASATGGVVTILSGRAAAGDETFAVSVDPDARSITATAGPVTLTGDLPRALDWHCIELKLDADAGEAELWIDGRSLGVATGDLASLATNSVWIGGPKKDHDAVGMLYLDDWVLADGYVGLVHVEPKSTHADDPARWLIVYNLNSPDSCDWAAWYRQQRNVPYRNLLGVEASTDEQISEDDFFALRSQIIDYLARHELTTSITGIVLGHHVPGMYEVDGAIESIASQLHYLGDDSTDMIGNWASAEAGELARPTETMLAGLRLVARIDGPTLADSQALTSRAQALAEAPLNGQTTIWLDPYGLPGSVYDPDEQRMQDWANSLDRQALRLTLHTSADTEPDSDVQFDQIHNDGFFWGWRQVTVPEGFFASPAGPRVFCYQLHFDGPTMPTLRDAAGASWGISALQAGYAATAGSPRAHVAHLPRVGTFFEALRRGWTLGEAWFIANPTLRSGLTLAGDPLLTVSMPKAGWNLYGPFSSLSEADLAQPAAMLREDERSADLIGSLAPVEGSTNLYALRRVDDQGREETGVTTVVRSRTGDLLTGVPPLPAWPRHPGWRATQCGTGWRIDAVFGARFCELGITSLELIEQAVDSEPEVVERFALAGGDSRMSTVHTPTSSPVRFAWRAIGPDGGAHQSAWSGWHALPTVAAKTLELL